jgi:hypothetical protein
VTSIDIDDLIEMADAHAEADEYLAGAYWLADGGKGCSIGCTARDCGLEPNDHAGLAAVLGIEVRVCHVIDSVFEWLPIAERSAWTPRVLRAARDGAGRRTGSVWLAFADRMLTRIIDRGARDRLAGGAPACVTVVRDLCRERVPADDPRWASAGAAARAEAAARWAAARWKKAAARPGRHAEARAAAAAEVRQQADDLCELLAGGGGGPAGASCGGDVYGDSDGQLRMGVTS